MPEPEAVQQGQWRDLQALLDQELNGLPENYRRPILLCDLEGKTIKEAAQQLGWPQGSLAGRLARGRKLLAKRLAGRGVVLSAGSLAAVVSHNAASAGVPASLMSSTVKAAAMIAVGQATLAGAVPAKVAVLMEGVMKAMLLNKFKGVAGIVLVVGMLGVGLEAFSLGTAADAPLEVIKNTGADAKADKEASVQDNVPKTDEQQLQGSWLVESMLVDGKEAPKDELNISKVTFDGDKVVTTSPSGVSKKFSFKIDPETKPKSLDAIKQEDGEEGKTVPLIYKLNADTLTLCEGGDKDRPRSLTVKMQRSSF